MNEKEKFLNYVGDVKEGRANLGLEMPVSVYRLFEYTMRETLIENYGYDRAVALFRQAGEKAGRAFAANLLDLSLDFDSFVAHLQKQLASLKIGILRIESFDEHTGKMMLTVSEDLDCSGLPVQGNTVCNYDEGFIGGILSEYTKNPYCAEEIDCWVKGDRVCRFVVQQKAKNE